MAVAKKQTAAQPRTRTAKKTAATSAAAVESAPAQPAAETAAAQSTAAETAPVETPAGAANGTVKTDTTKPAAPNADESGNRISVTIPLDSAVVGVALKAVTLPVNAAKKVAQNKNGIPAYVAVGGLAVIGAVEWPIAAVGGLSLAALRRWGPLKPEQQQEPKPGPKPQPKKSA